MKSAPSQSQDKFIVRLPDGLRDRIQAAAAASGRSMNTEIVRVLEEAFPAPVSKESSDLKMIDGYLALVDSAQNETEREERLAKVNAALAADPRSAMWQIITMPTRSGKHLAAFVPKR